MLTISTRSDARFSVACMCRGIYKSCPRTKISPRATEWQVWRKAHGGTTPTICLPHAEDTSQETRKLSTPAIAMSPARSKPKRQAVDSETPSKLLPDTSGGGPLTPRHPFLRRSLRGPLVPRRSSSRTTPNLSKSGLSIIRHPYILCPPLGVRPTYLRHPCVSCLMPSNPFSRPHDPRHPVGRCLLRDRAIGSSSSLGRVPCRNFLLGAALPMPPFHRVLPILRALQTKPPRASMPENRSGDRSQDLSPSFAGQSRYGCRFAPGPAKSPASADAPYRQSSCVCA